MFPPTVELHIRQATSSATGSASASASGSSQSTPSPTSSNTSSSSPSSSITSSSTSASASAIHSSSSGSSHTGRLIGGIIGGVVGGLILITLISILFTGWRRRRNNARKRPRGSVYFNSIKMTRDAREKDAHSSVSHFLSPSSHPPQLPRHTTDSLTSSMSLLPARLEERESMHHNTNSTAAPDAHDGQGLRSPYSIDVGSRGGHIPEGSSDSLPMPSPYSEHGHGNEDEPDSPMPPPVLAAYDRDDFRRMSLIQPDFSLAALEASLTGSPKSLRSPALPASPVDITPRSEIDGFTLSKPVTAFDEHHTVAPSANSSHSGSR
ncbi:hypothetical protein D9758_006788 [Tetrapyrgos nigripes]|uniref:Uncharacterized protein n=1 Tax=Tetrapyrgos nigripes TaxID=182062 RepID=A0A8H5CXY6_9AGAR|nr:hypothetical protein D9758_006788 [Tetrapyrgos nigripes]